jgi:hypothetical protein
MFSNFQANHQVKPTAKVKPCLEIANLHKRAITPQVVSIQPRAIDAAHILNTSALKSSEPRSEATPHIKDRAWLHIVPKNV